MSEQNVKLVRSIFRPGDPSRFFDLLDEKVEFDFSAVPLLPDRPAVIHGKDAVIEYYRHYWGTWDDYDLEPAEITEVGEHRVLAVQHERGRGRASGAPFERIAVAAVFTLRAGKVIRRQSFNTREEALEAARLEK